MDDPGLHYRRLLDAVVDYVFRVRVENGRAVETVHSANCEAVTGYTPEEFQANPLLWIAMVPAEDRATVERQVANLLAGREVAPIEHRILRKDGHVRWVLKTASPEFDSACRLIAYDGLLRDITPRMEAERALQQLNETLEQRVSEQTQEIRGEHELNERIINTAQHIVLLIDAQGRIIQFNRYFEELTGWRLDEVKGRDWFDTFLAECDRERIRNVFGQALSGQRTQGNVNTILTKDGRERDVEWYDAPLSSARGELIGLLCTGQDVTERSRAETALRESEERFRLFMDNSPTIAWMKDEAGRYVYLSRTHEERYDVRLEDWRGKTDFDLWPREIAEEFRSNDLKVLAGKKPVEVVEEAPNPDGTLSCWRVFKVPFADSEGIHYVGGIGVDITERKRAEEAVHEREERIRAILDTATDAIITIDRQGTIKSVNPATERIFGYTRDELIGRNVKILMPPPFHDEHDTYIARYVETGEARIISIGREVVGRHKDGRNFPVDLAISEVDHLGLFTGIVRDISERKRLEGELLTIAAEEQQRIGQDLHDDTGQELTAMMLTADTLLEDVEAGAIPDDALLRKLRDGLQRVAAQVRTYSRGLIPVEVDPEGLQAALRELARTMSELHNVDCTFDCREQIRIASTTVATHLYRIAQEAVTNAIRHAEPSHVWIDLRPANGNIILRVRDDGRGMGEAPDDTAGMGLRIMRHRASLIQGQLIVGPAGERGTEVRCTVMKGT